LGTAVLPRRYLLLLLFPACLIGFGMVGYVVLEPNYTPFDALYMTVMTITTVGYGEVHRLSTAGRAFTIFLMLGGIFTMFYAAGELIRAIVSGEVRTALGRYRMEQSLARLNYHVIVCGFGRMGRLVCREFDAKGIAFVVIEKQAELLADFNLKHGIALAGDATSDEVLQRAGVQRARAVVSVLGTNADNLYVTMSARLLNDRLFIVSRSEDEAGEEKLRRAGANRVVSPYAIGGSRVASAVLRPAVVDFIELATRSEHMELQIEETLITPTSKLVGTTLKESHLRQDYGIIIVAIKKPTGAMVFNPPSDARIEAGDTLITLGHRQQLDQLEALARG
jgi:voltage-gated potassium channel